MIRPVHFPDVPRFLHGHNARLAPPKPRKERPPATPCACGCGNLATPGRKFISGHNATGRRLSDEARQRLSIAASGANNPHYGKRPPNWNGGRTLNNGYVYVWMPEHPVARGPYVAEHRLVVEEHLRATDPHSEFLRDGFLHPGADVHHVNRVKDDNRLENLEVMWRSEHTRLHRHDLAEARWPKD